MRYATDSQVAPQVQGHVTPFSAYAFHPLDGWLQGCPYHIFIFLFPMHHLSYFIALGIVGLWTINIHAPRVDEDSVRQLRDAITRFITPCSTTITANTLLFGIRSVGRTETLTCTRRTRPRTHR